MAACGVGGGCVRCGGFIFPHSLTLSFTVKAIQGNDSITRRVVNSAQPAQPSSTMGRPSTSYSQVPPSRSCPGRSAHSAWVQRNAYAGTPSLLTNGHAAASQPTSESRGCPMQGGGAGIAGTATPMPVRNPGNLQKVRLPFYDVLETVVPVTALRREAPLHIHSRQQTDSFQCRARPRRCKTLRSKWTWPRPKQPATSANCRGLCASRCCSWRTDEGAGCSFTDDKGLPRVELQLRFFKYDPSAPQKEDFPSKAVVRLDANMVQLPATIPTNKPNVEPRRPSRPVDITATAHPFLHPRPRPFKLLITWAQKPDAYHVFTIEVVRRLTADILVQRLVNKGVRPAEAMKRMVREKLTASDDDGVVTDSLRVALTCPLGMMRVGLPGKTLACTHPACFDVRTFLAMNEKKPTWTCPSCHKPAHFDDLVLEGFPLHFSPSLLLTRPPSRRYYADILKDPATKEAVEVELFANGSYRGISEKQKQEEKEGKAAAKAEATKPVPAPAPAPAQSSRILAWFSPRSKLSR